MVTVGFFGPIRGVGYVHLSDWGRTDIQLRHMNVLIALAWVAGGGCWSLCEPVEACSIRLVICDSDYIVSSHMSHIDSACWLSSTNIQYH